MIECQCLVSHYCNIFQYPSMKLYFIPVCQYKISSKVESNYRRIIEQVIPVYHANYSTGRLVKRQRTHRCPCEEQSILKSQRSPTNHPYSPAKETEFIFSSSFYSLREASWTHSCTKRIEIA